MPSTPVYQLECDRCGRKWLSPPVDEGEPKTPSLELALRGPDGDVAIKANFEVLCGSCVKTLYNYGENMCKDVRASLERRAKKRGPKAPLPVS